MQKFTFKEFSNLQSHQKLLLLGNFAIIFGFSLCSAGSLLQILNEGSQLPSTPPIAGGFPQTSRQENSAYTGNRNYFES